MITYKFTVSIGFVGAEHEDTFTVEDMGYTESEWNELSEDERENILEETWKDFSSNYIDGYWEIVD